MNQVQATSELEAPGIVHKIAQAQQLALVAGVLGNAIAIAIHAVVVVEVGRGRDGPALEHLGHVSVQLSRSKIAYLCAHLGFVHAGPFGDDVDRAGQCLGRNQAGPGSARHINALHTPDANAVQAIR